MDEGERQRLEKRLRHEREFLAELEADMRLYQDDKTQCLRRIRELKSQLDEAKGGDADGSGGI